MNKFKISLLFGLLLFFSACSNVWDEHTKVNDDVLQENIFDYLESNSDFSSFVELLKNAGLDTYLSSSAIYTVWAPTNQALSGIDQSLINTDEKLQLFVNNHIVSGIYSTLANKPATSLKMRSGKMLQYDGANDLIDGISITPTNEVTAKNGVIQIINQPLVPRYSIWDYIRFVAPQGKFVTYLQSLTNSVFDLENSPQIGVNDFNQPIYDSIWLEQNSFFLNVTDLSAEDSTLTLIIPSDEVFSAEFTKFERFYRRDDKASNEFPTTRDSIYIRLMIARDMVFGSPFAESDVPDTLISYFNVKVPFNKSSLTGSYKASNGYVYHLSDCAVKPTNKILPIVMEAENCIYGAVLSSAGSYIRYTTAGTGNPYFRLRADASQGFDLIVDNSHKSEILSGALFAGPVVSSIKYRVKIRAINDFNKSYLYPSADTPLKQWLGQVTITRDPITQEIVAISPATNAFNSGTQYGTPDVTYDSADPSTYYVSIDSTKYSPLIQAFDDEIDLGYYNFSKADNVFLRLIPQSAQMAVMADYFRLVPIFE